MDDPDKANEVQEMTVKLDFNGLTLLVSNRGVIYDEEGNEIPQRTIRNKQTGYTNPYPYINITYGGTSHNVQVSRLVCMAFHPIEGGDYASLQADHKDNDPKNNRASNLRWVSRKFNNSRKHTRMMKSQNYKRTSHKDEFLKAENLATGEVRFFKNGIHAAKGLGCSHVLIYNAISGRMTTNAKGWRLSWISREAEEAQEFKRELELKSMQKDLLRAQKELDAKEARRKLKEEAKRMEIEVMRIRKQAIERERRQIAEQTEIEIANIKRHTKETMEEMKERHKEEMKRLVWERHAILQYTQDGEFVREWRCVREATRATGITNISKNLHGAIDNAGGFVWKWKVER